MKVHILSKKSIIRILFVALFGAAHAPMAAGLFSQSSASCVEMTEEDFDKELKVAAETDDLPALSKLLNYQFKNPSKTSIYVGLALGSAAEAGKKNATAFILDHPRGAEITKNLFVSSFGGAAQLGAYDVLAFLLSHKRNSEISAEDIGAALCNAIGWELYVETESRPQFDKGRNVISLLLNHSRAGVISDVDLGKAYHLASEGESKDIVECVEKSNRYNDVLLKRGT